MGVTKALGYATFFGIAAAGLDVADSYSQHPSMPWHKTTENIIQVDYYADRTNIRETATGKTWELGCTGTNVNFTMQYRWNFHKDGYAITCGNELGAVRTQPGDIKRKIHVQLPFGINLD